MSEKAEARPDRPAAGPLLYFSMEEHVNRLKQEQAWVSGNRNAITLVKEPSLRVVLTIMGKGAKLHEHQAAGPFTFHLLSGLVRFRATGSTLELAPGALVVLEAAIPHEVEALEESAFLLTLLSPA